MRKIYVFTTIPGEFKKEYIETDEHAYAIVCEGSFVRISQIQREGLKTIWTDLFPAHLIQSIFILENAYE